MSEPTNETCPHCGAGRTNDDKHVEWTCGSLQWGPRVRMSDHCETRHNLAAVTAERDTWMRNFDDVAHKLADMQQRIDAAPVAWVLYCWNGSMTIHTDIPSCSQSFPERARVRLVTDDQPGD